MALTSTPAHAVEPVSGHVVGRRLPGPDVVRAVALIGVVVMNFHGYLIIAADETSASARVGSGWAADLFDPWNGPLSTRFAATFVLVAGVGVTLLTRSSIGDPARVTTMRWRLVRRGVLLYVVGLLLDLIWPGTIIPYYGAMFAAAAAIFTLRIRWIVAIGTIAALAGAGVNAWLFWQAEDGNSTEWLTYPGTGSVRGYAFDVFVNGTHPLLPWFAFMCAGIVLGRLLAHAWWRPVAITAGIVLYTVATLAGVVRVVAVPAHRAVDRIECRQPRLRGERARHRPRRLLVHRLGGRTLPTGRPTRCARAGQMTLTIYLAHVFVFNLVVDWLDWIDPAGLDVALVFALGFWTVAIIAAAAWQRRFGIGPAERFYRAFSG